MKVFIDLACMSTCFWALPKPKYGPFKTHKRAILRLVHALIKQNPSFKHATTSTSQCGKICKTPPKCISKERRRNYYSRCSIIAATSIMSWRCCVSLWKYFVWAKEDTIRNQWLSCIYNTVPEQFNPNIRVCTGHFTEGSFLNLGVTCQACEHTNNA